MRATVHKLGTLKLDWKCATEMPYHPYRLGNLIYCLITQQYYYLIVMKFMQKERKSDHKICKNRKENGLTCIYPYAYVRLLLYYIILYLLYIYYIILYRTGNMPFPQASLPPSSHPPQPPSRRPFRRFHPYRRPWVMIHLHVFHQLLGRPILSSVRSCITRWEDVHISECIHTQIMHWQQTRK